MALPLPELEGKYEILEKIREGGMGAIYKVRHRLLEEVRVVKVMRTAIEENKELRAVDRFLREAKIAIKLRHPNIAQLYDFSSDESGTGYIVMEYIHGLTLDDILRTSGTPSVELTMEIAFQSLEALSALHANAFVHRDISPDNLMVARDVHGRPLVKLIDLGIAKHLQSAEGVTRTGTFLGKYRYASPEMFHDGSSGDVDQRSDLYSFGVVLYELLTKSHPVVGTEVSSVIAGHLFRPPRPFDETDPEGRVPEGLRKVVFKALQKNVDDRYQTAAEMSVDIRELMPAGEPWRDEMARLMELREQISTLFPPSATTQGEFDDQFPPEQTKGTPDFQPNGGDRGERTVAVSSPRGMKLVGASGKSVAPISEMSDDLPTMRVATLKMSDPPPASMVASATVFAPPDSSLPLPTSVAAAPAASRLPLNPAVIGAAVLGLLVVVAVVIGLAFRGGDSGSTIEGSTPQPTADAVVAAEAPKLAPLLERARAALDSKDWEDARLALDELNKQQAEDQWPESVRNIVADVRQRLAAERSEELRESLGQALTGDNVDILRAELGNVTDQVATDFEATGAAQLLVDARATVQAFDRFEETLRTGDPGTALEMAIALRGKYPALAPKVGARERAAQALEAEADQLVRTGHGERAERLLLVMRKHWADRPGLAERLSQTRAARNAPAVSVTESSALVAAQRALEQGQPHEGLKALEGVQLPGNERKKADDLTRQLRAELARRDGGVPTIELKSEAVEFRKGAPVVLEFLVTDDYGVEAVAVSVRNAERRVTNVRATPIGNNTYRMSVPPEFHLDEPFDVWAVARDWSSHENLLGSADQPVQFERKRWFRRRGN